MTSSTGAVPSVHFIVIYTNAILACSFNSVLLYLIRTTVTGIGSYRILLSVMAIFNLSYSVIHVLDAPLVVAQDHMVIFSASGIFEKNPIISYPLTLAYCSFFAQSLVLLMYHFVYRYIAVCKSHLMTLMHKPKTIFVCVLVYVLVAATWIVICAIFLQDEVVKQLMSDMLLKQFGINLTTAGAISVGYMYPSTTGSEFNLRPWLGSLLAYVLMGISFSIMTFCAISIQRKLRNCQTVSIQKSHQVQVQLFRALIIQTVVPLIIEYCACFMILFIPMTGLPINAEFTTLCISAYPVVEPLVVIYFVRDYRTALMKKLGLWKPTVVSASQAPTTTWSYPPQQSILTIRERFYNMQR